MIFRRTLLTVFTCIAATLIGIAYLSPISKNRTNIEESHSIVEQPINTTDIDGLIQTAYLRNTSIFEALEQPLSHREETIRFRAVQALNRDPSSEATRFLLDRAVNDPSNLVRTTALKIVSIRKGNEALPAIIQALSDPCIEIQETALWIVLRDKPPGALSMILNATRNRMPTSGQIHAVGLLGQHEQSAITFLINTALQWPEKTTSAMISLSRIGDSCLDLIETRILRSTSFAEKQCLTELFRYLNTPKALELIDKLASHPSPEIRKAAYQAMTFTDTSAMMAALLNYSKLESDRDAKLFAEMLLEHRR